MIHSPLQISKDRQDFKNTSSHVVAVHFLAFIMRTGTNTRFLPLTHIQALETLNEKYFSVLIYDFEEMPFCIVCKFGRAKMQP